MVAMHQCTHRAWTIVALLALVNNSLLTLPSVDLTYINNSEVRQMVEMHLDICGYTEACHLFDKTNETVPLDSPCGQCKCSKDCFVNRTCCPDLYQQLETAKESENRDNDNKKCVIPAVSMRNWVTSKPKHLVGQCPDDVPIHSSISRQCQSDYLILWKEGRQEYAIPVTDKSNSSQNFKNLFCAICHGLSKSDVIYWQISIMSWYEPELPSTYTNNRMSSYLYELQKELLNNNIHLVFSPPGTVPETTVSCTIDRCNETGLWQKYDNFTERACLTYNTGFLNNSFANIFCVQCNGFNNTLRSAYLDKYPASYVAFIDINDLESADNTETSKASDEERCGDKYIYDPFYRKCREMICPNLFHLYNYTCRAAYRNLVGFQYLLIQDYKPINTQPITYTSVSQLQYDVRNEMSDHLLDINQTTGYDFTLRNSQILYTLNVTYTYNDLEPILSTMTILNVELRIAVELWSKVLSQHQSFEEMVHALQTFYTKTHLFSSILIKKKSEILPWLSNSDFYTIKTLTDQMRGYLNTTRKDAGTLNFMVPRWDFSTTRRTPTVRSEKPAPIDGHHYVLITTDLLEQDISTEGEMYISPQGKCPYIVLNSNEYIKTSHGFKLPVIDQSVHKEYNVGHPFTDFITMCAITYMDIIKQKLLKTGSKYMFTTEAILSMACSGISILSLLITITIYATVKELQTLPGFMIIFVCLNLLCCQVLYVLTNVIHIPGPWLCTAIGVILHFAILSYLFWMNVSTFHMLKAFTSISLISKTKKMKKYQLLVLGCATFFILLNIGVSLVITKGKEIGYGGEICYINTAYMIGITFVLPLCIVIVANTVMFILAIRSVVTTDDIIAISNRKYILIFTKLSTLTGITWIFGLMHQWSELQLLAYVFIILNASQGVFIMVAFTFNQRMYRAIKRLSASTNITQ